MKPETKAKYIFLKAADWKKKMQSTRAKRSSSGGSGGGESGIFGGGLTFRRTSSGGSFFSRNSNSASSPQLSLPTNLNNSNPSSAGESPVAGLSPAGSCASENIFSDRALEQPMVEVQATAALKEDGYAEYFEAYEQAYDADAHISILKGLGWRE